MKKCAWVKCRLKVELNSLINPPSVLVRHAHVRRVCVYMYIFKNKDILVSKTQLDKTKRQNDLTNKVKILLLKTYKYRAPMSCKNLCTCSSKGDNFHKSVLTAFVRETQLPISVPSTCKYMTTFWGTR